MYIRGNIHYVICEELMKSPNTETIWCQVTTMTGSVLVGVCYHSTCADLEKEIALHDVIRKACAACNNVVIFGDFNHRSIYWKMMYAVAEGARFLELAQDLFLTQHVHVETRGENIVDLILSTEPNMIDAIRVKEPFSDHNIVTCDVI